MLVANAETIRVSNWNLEGLGTNENALSESAELLKSLGPDVILLQGVRDWKVCGEIAERLKPAEYHVLVCSAFPAAGTGALGPRQVAVLSRLKAYFSWSEPWRQTQTTDRSGTQTSLGGFAFVALEFSRHRFGFFSADLGTTGSADAQVNQLLGQEASVARWQVNQVKTFVAGFGSPSDAGKARVAEVIEPMQKAGYSTPFTELWSDDSAASGPESEKALADSILAESSVFPLRPVISTTLTSRHPILTCDLELDPAKVAAGWTQRAQELARMTAERRDREKAASLAAGAAEKSFVALASAWLHGWRLAVVIAGGSGLLVLLWRVLRSGRRPEPSRPALLGAGMTSSYSLVLPAPGGSESCVERSLQSGQNLPLLPLETGPWQTHSIPPDPVPESARAGLAQDPGTRANLLHWLKQRFLRRLLADRSALLEAQHQAALKALKVDERLAKIEKQIQQQTRTYELRIEDLTRELLAAREENRELIRARIAQVKLEMESVRARMLAEAQEEIS